MKLPSARTQRALFALAGLGAAALLARHTDLRALRAIGPWFAAVVALEGTRILLELQASRALYGDDAAVPFARLLRVQAAGYAMAMALPAGRTAAEAAKAVVLAGSLGAARAASAGAALQGATLLGVAAMSVPCGLAARALGAHGVATALAVQSVALGAAGVALLVALRSARAAAWLRRGWPSAPTPAHLDTATLVRACAWMTAHRAVPALECALLLAVSGCPGALRALGLQGAAMLGATAGDAVPGQLGALGGAMALAAPHLGVPTGTALATAAALHGAQLVWVLVGAACAWTERRAG